MPSMLGFGTTSVIGRDAVGFGLGVGGAFKWDIFELAIE
jgi:hypothetical protein